MAELTEKEKYQRKAALLQRALAEADKLDDQNKEKAKSDRAKKQATEKAEPEKTDTEKDEKAQQAAAEPMPIS